jgi:cyclic pyranopterin phosphate synthase
MPAEGMTWLDRSEVLTFEEIERVSRICVERFGIDSLRLTGGEPTVRAHLPRLITQLAALRLADGSKPDIALTTNGATLRNIASELRDAGLNRINVSLDSLRADRFLAMTRRDELDNVLAGIAEAKEAGFDLIKVNAVVERGANDDEILDMARYGRDNGLEVRFIEFMPLDASNIWERNKVVTQDEIVSAISAEFVELRLQTVGAMPTARELLVLSQACRNRSVPIVIVCVSRVMASSVHVCSQLMNSIFVPCCAMAVATMTSRISSFTQWEPSGQATKSIR